MIKIGGLSIAVMPETALRPAERALLEALDAEPSSGPPDFTLDIAEDRNAERVGSTVLPGYGEPAAVETVGDAVRVVKESFEAQLLPYEGRGWLRRDEGPDLALLTVLKIILTCMLPRHGGVALHSAAVVNRRGALVFCGPSGAGKSTVAGLSPYPVLSDELIALVEEGGVFTVRSTGFWGTLDASDAPRGSFIADAFFILGKGTSLSFERLSGERALRSLLGVALLPPLPMLWRESLGVLGRFSRSVPAYKMIWHPSAPPWSVLESHWGLLSYGGNRHEVEG